MDSHGSWKDVAWAQGLVILSFGNQWLQLAHEWVTVGTGVSACVMAVIGVWRFVWDVKDRAKRKIK